MKKEDRVKTKEDFNSIINKGKKSSFKICTVFFINDSNVETKFGISAPKKLGNAVLRNKLKRQMRHIIRINRNLFKNNRKYIIIMKEAFLKNSFEQNLNEFERIIGEINEK